MAIDKKRFAKLEQLFNSLDPQSSGCLPFPSMGDLGEGNLDDTHLAQVIQFGGSGDDEAELRLAIRLGRALEKAGL